MSETKTDAAVEAEARQLEELSVKLIREKNWRALEQLLSPACQFVTGQGSCDRTEAMKLMKEMNLGEVRFKDFKTTQAGDNLMVSFWLSASESIGGKVLSTGFSPRLSVWQRVGTDWQCVAYADLKPV
ncbi:MAG: nuclear transport factor 2 family protein [Chthoniobacterales bacterium]|nr:nuclear transport factor 2 family protein [Chthoniobacterales bacterium]